MCQTKANVKIIRRISNTCGGFMAIPLSSSKVPLNVTS